MHRTRRALPILIATLLALTLAACGDGAASSSAADSPSPAVAAPPSSPSPDAAATTAPSEPAADAATTFTSCGVEQELDGPPERTVVSESNALETLLALGVNDRIVGYFGAEPDQLGAEFSDAAADLERFGESFPPPSLEAVLSPDPDLVVSYGFNPEAGFTAERLAEEGVPSYAFEEVCPDFSGAITFDSFFAEVTTLGEIFGVADTAQATVDEWTAELESITQRAPEEPVRVFLFGGFDPAEAFTSGGLSLATDIIARAGGTNVFADTEETFLTPSWEEVVARDPQVIIDGSGNGQEGLDRLIAYVESTPGLSDMAAVRDGNYAMMSFLENVPGPQAVDGVATVADAIADVDG